MRILFVCDGFRKIDLGIDLIANAFRWSIQSTRLFSIFSSFYFYVTLFIFSKKRKGVYSCLPSKDSINYLYSKDSFTYSIQYKMLLVRLHVYRSIKLKAYKLFENSDENRSKLVFT